MRISFLALAASLCFFGAGCASGLTARTNASLPSLEIREPANGATVSTNTIEIIGKTTAKQVVIGSDAFPVQQDEFRIPMVVVPGKNAFTITAGTGYSTTTETIFVERLVSIPR